MGKKHLTQSASNSPSIGTEVFNSLLANNEPHISESDWAVGCFANSGKSLDCESSGNRGFGRSREGTDLGEQVLESLVAHRLIDLGSEWHLLRHRYKHSAWEIYLAKTMRWHPKTSYIAVWTHS